MNKLIFAFLLTMAVQNLQGAEEKTPPVYPRRITYPNGSYSIQKTARSQLKFYLPNGMRDRLLEQQQQELELQEYLRLELLEQRLEQRQQQERKKLQERQRQRLERQRQRLERKELQEYLRLERQRQERQRQEQERKELQKYLRLERLERQRQLELEPVALEPAAFIEAPKF
ncbi:hypothetical protein KBC04_00865 [Candidatus Babeliales bacterium]|nr:hypothetical protein [Candidatus Babeliales bacterium]MBP9843357.1 hypothetical protein [Candidatus Babeliales bacterium]